MTLVDGRLEFEGSLGSITDLLRAKGVRKVIIIEKIYSILGQ